MRSNSNSQGWAARRVGRAAIGALAALCLTGCTIATPAASATGSATASSVQLAAPAAGASVVVTVPDLGGLAAPPARSGAVAVKPTATSALSITPPSSAVPVPPTVPAAAAAVPSTMNVTLTNCPGCTVLATHAAITSSLGAALVATAQGRAALLSLRGDGSVAGAANIADGTSFPTPPGGQLGCDSNGRCIVVAQQNGGTAIASAYQASAQGIWADVTGRPGITSVTSKAITLTVGGAIGVAVQDQADGTTVWIVYGWDGKGYSVKGCTPAATPDPNVLTMTSCLS